eukprot:GFYU01006685.1.p1 GENE.GFYU01006685.1~~GFYU01006685.1.p1  ORF type:complete len:153 (+),score=43.04 GFYU01006685.1:256-714(+)
MYVLQSKHLYQFYVKWKTSLQKQQRKDKAVMKRAVTAAATAAATATGGTEAVSDVSELLGGAVGGTGGTGDAIGVAPTSLFEIPELETLKTLGSHTERAVPETTIVVRPSRGKKKRLRSRNTYIDEHLDGESGDDAYADLEDFIVTKQSRIE